ncbi:MAG: 16S rRNA processing protein RimM [Firmicutes bacterium]|nr:16S rRNA processing protein RimM [Bacillota bacterium]
MNLRSRCSMELVYIGDIVNTHGLKGEIRIISDFKYKEEVFKKGNILYVGYDKEKLEINSYRKHKIYDMITFKDINSINDVIGYKGDKVYINRLDYKFSGPLDEDIIGMEVYSEDTFVGSVTAIMKNSVQDILVVEKNGNKNMVPLVEEFVKNIDLQNNKIEINIIEGLINEN